MKSTVALLSGFAAISTALAGTFYSPQPGANLTRGSTFNLTYDTGRYFKEAGLDVTVGLAFASAWGGNGSSSAVVARDLTANKTFLPYSSNGVSVELPVYTLYTDDYDPTPVVLVVYEHYHAYGGYDAEATYTLNVTVSGSY